MKFLAKCEDATCNGHIYPADMPNCPKCGASEAFSSEVKPDARFWGYDIETYPDAFTVTFIHAATGNFYRYKITEFQNDREQLVQMMMFLGSSGALGIGFNSIAFDYPVLHYIANNGGCTVSDVYSYAMSVINSQSKFGFMIWEKDRIFKQVDLFKIRHFDNIARATSLKSLEIAMKSPDVKDLPYPPGTRLTRDQIENDLIPYNDNDTIETLKFAMRCISEIEFREELSVKYGRDFMNHNDTKIGKDYFIMELEKAGIPCFDRGPQGRSPRQTIRESIALKDVIFPIVNFERPEFNEILRKFSEKTLTKKQLDEVTKDTALTTKGVFSDLNVTVHGLKYVYGVGGIHASVKSQTVITDEEGELWDWDVTSFYPYLAIVNKLYPAHLSEKFCDIYLDVYNQRKGFAKGTSENAMLKLALNGVYGDSNNKYSPFFDPRYTMSITVNGQLLLTMLVEQLIKIPNLKMIQCNTDGLTVKCPKCYVEHMKKVCEWWESLTGLVLESAQYSKMFIRDVNNYIAVGMNGKVKRIGAYEWDYEWHKDPSAMVSVKAAEQFLLNGISPRDFITQHKDMFDFMLRAKVPRASRLELRYDFLDVALNLQNTTRYYVTQKGGALVKVSPPTGEPGSWKRKNGITDELYRQVNAELLEKVNQMNDMGGVPSAEGITFDRKFYPTDSLGIMWDDRIHNKKRTKHDTRELGLCVGNLVTECARASLFDWGRVNYEYYINEANKLIEPVMNH